MEEIKINANNQILIQTICLIDKIVNKQVNQILHHHSFQKLESSWRGLHLLTNESRQHKQIIIKILDINHQELRKDLLDCLEYDQCQLFKKIVLEEFDMPGGFPFGVLIGNYYFDYQAYKNSYDDVDSLKILSQICAKAFSPFISSISPSFFGLKHFSELRSSFDYHQMLKDTKYFRWKYLQEFESSAFIGLCLPRVLLRNSYDNTKNSHPYFKEIIQNFDDHLWGNCAFVYGAVLIKAFKQNGWLARTVGISSDKLSGGTYTNLARNYFDTDQENTYPKHSTEIILTDNHEKKLSDLGFLALQDNPLWKTSIFFNSYSIYLSNAKHTSLPMNSWSLSNKLNHLFSATRFAHYIKTLIRDKIGTFTTAESCEDFLQEWILGYCGSNKNGSEEAKARYPLSEAKIDVKEKPGQSGCYVCTVLLKPHYQLKGIDSHLCLKTDFTIN